MCGTPSQVSPPAWHLSSAGSHSATHLGLPLFRATLPVRPQAWRSSASLLRLCFSSHSETKVIFPNCHPFADNLQIYNSSLNFSTRFWAQMPKLPAADEGPSSASHLKIFITDFFPPTTPKLLFPGLHLFLSFPSPVKVATNHLFDQVRSLSDTLEPCRCPTPASKQVLCSLSSTSVTLWTSPVISFLLPGLLPTLSKFPWATSPFPHWCPSLCYCVLSILLATTATEVFSKVQIWFLSVLLKGIIDFPCT